MLHCEARVCIYACSQRLSSTLRSKGQFQRMRTETAICLRSKSIHVYESENGGGLGRGEGDRQADSAPDMLGAGGALAGRGREGTGGEQPGRWGH